MDIIVDIENVSTNQNIPALDEITLWVNLGLSAQKKLAKNTEISIRIVDTEEIQALNQQYRNKNKPTNVLSFPADLPEGVNIPLLGDIVICADVVEEEATRQGKTNHNHWAHMIIHGTLHLLGYDHMSGDDAEKMESLEITLLQKLGIDSPYER